MIKGKNGDFEKTESHLGWLERIARWLFSLDQREKKPTDPSEVLYRSFHITAKCRFNASIRLNHIGSFSFLTATLLSLGLIFIPTLQLSEVQLAYPEKVLDGLQVFFAIAVLIYSVINSTAHYETRAKALNECADKIKDLSRKLRTEIHHAKNTETEMDLQPFLQVYSTISAASENHSRSDYVLAMLQANDLYHITGLPRLWLNIKVLFGDLEGYFFSILLIFAEIIVILDILNVTRVLTNVFTSH